MSCGKQSWEGKLTTVMEVLNTFEVKKMSLSFVPFPAVVEPVEVAPLEAGDFKSLVQEKHIET